MSFFEGSYPFDDDPFLTWPSENACDIWCFEGNDSPFDDPFFTDTFDDFGDDSFFSHPFDGKSSSERRLKEIAIEKSNSGDNTQKNHSISSEKLIITFPSENASGNQQRVGYGGLEGMYHTSSMARRSTGDGGHSLTTKHNPDGKVDDTVRTLDNLVEDELASIDEAWKGNVQRSFSGWDDGLRLLEYAAMCVEASSSGWWPPEHLKIRKE